MITYSQPGERTDDGLRFHVSLAPHAEWELDLQFAPGLDAAEAEAAVAALPAEGRRVEASLSAWRQTVPKLTTSDVPAAALVRPRDRRSGGATAARQRQRRADRRRLAVVHDRIRPRHDHREPADAPARAGPGAHGAAGARAAPGDRGRRLDRREPGKIVHELRSGKGASAFFARYYGTVDATPLFLVLLSEVWRWTRDDEFARELREPALLALAWIDDWGDSDGDGFVEYERRVARRAGEPDVEGLARLAALPRRNAGAGADRSRGGSGLRVRREAAAGRAGARGVGGRGTGRNGSRARQPSYGGVSTRRSGASVRAAGPMRSPSTARNGR